jgi:hypothetical protein
VASDRINLGGWLAVGLAVLGGLVSLVNEIVRYRDSGAVDWGHVALAFGVPALMYAIVSPRQQHAPERPDGSVVTPPEAPEDR